MIGRGEKTSINHWNRKRIWFTLKCRSYKTQVFLLTIRTVFPMFDKKHCIVRRNADTLWCLLGALGISSGNRQRWHRDVPARRRWTWMWICAGCRNRLVLFEILSAPCRLAVASASGGQCRYPVKASGKTVYHQAKHAAKNNWHFPSHKQISFG